MKTASFSIAILNFFSRHGQYFHPTKDQPRTRPCSTFLYICYNFRQIFCTNIIQFFSVKNMGHNQLKKCTEYHLVSLLNEKQGSTFANFLDLFYPLTLLTIVHCPRNISQRNGRTRNCEDFSAKTCQQEIISFFV